MHTGPKWHEALKPLGRDAGSTVGASPSLAAAMSAYEKGLPVAQGLELHAGDAGSSEAVPWGSILSGPISFRDS